MLVRMEILEPLELEPHQALQVILVRPEILEPLELEPLQALQVMLEP